MKYKTFVFKSFEKDFDKLPENKKERLIDQNVFHIIIF